MIIYNRRFKKAADGYREATSAINDVFESDVFLYNEERIKYITILTSFVDERQEIPYLTNKYWATFVDVVTQRYKIKSIKSYQQKTDELIKEFSRIVPGLLQRSRDKKIEEILN